MTPQIDNIIDAFDGDEPESEDSGPYDRFFPGDEWHTLHEDALYCAYARDEDFMWRWNIVRDGDIIQEGCSISLETARRSVGHVLAFYSIANSRTRAGDTDSGEGLNDEELSE